eukprot:CAMPEP_0202357582 /NCGR_PEP_ID=MMETSP1126-20121109/11552_1 /ASSEMBLY_ACC=CAM_ASM_000457 /TAXON_ID=3047 /ORGANISM="Dunaliella tertiolecta, Strain CCMP1320" /LENGTH=164 /DNA_ID=CAMNT_0048950493 /DNA_START=228 /DNA_END=722 /DNA_ORIENTATION=+
MDSLLDDVKSSGDRDISAFKHGILAALLLGFLLVILWIIFSFFVILGRYFSDVSMVYGFMLGWGAGIAMFQLLAGLVVQNAEELAKQAKDVGRWTDQDLQGYYATFAFSYILIVSFAFTVSILWFGCNYMRKAGSTSSAGARSNYSNPISTNELAVNNGKGTEV